MRKIRSRASGLHPKDDDQVRQRQGDRERDLEERELGMAVVSFLPHEEFSAMLISMRRQEGLVDLQETGQSLISPLRGSLGVKSERGDEEGEREGEPGFAAQGETERETDLI
jgi:hypothetical protein